MRVEITGLTFDLDDLDQNPGSDKQLCRELVGQFAQPGTEPELIFESMDRKQKRCRMEFPGRPGVTPDAIRRWLLDHGLVGFSVDLYF